MWFRKITAGAFGHLRGETLEFGRGLNIVHGRNESGKSTWHAALTVALCGRRHGSGSTKEEREFKKRRYPWDDPDRWAVTLEVELDDGRIVEIDRDLNAPRTTVLDIGMGGREVIDDLMYQGSPDGAKWLGLDRTTFPITASVGQANILSILELENPQRKKERDALQEHLARAAAGGTGETAAGAIERIQNFAKENIGLDRKNARKPLRLAINAAEKAEDQLSRVSERRRAYLDLASRVDENRRRVRHLERRQAAIGAVMAKEQAEEQANSLGQQVARIEEWQQQFPSGDPQASDSVNTTELAIAINGARKVPESVAIDLEPLEVLEGRLVELDRQKALVEALEYWEEAKARAEDLRRKVERLQEWERRFPGGDPQVRELINFTDIASAIARCNSVPAPAFTDSEPVEALEKRIAMLDESPPKPCPSPGDVQRWVLPFRAPVPPPKEGLQSQIEEARKEEARSKNPSRAWKRLAWFAMVGVVASAMVGVATEWVYGALIAGVASVVLVIFRSTTSKQKSASPVDTELLERQLQERRAYDAKVAEAHRILREWELPVDADAAVAEFYNRERAWSEQSAERRRLEELVGRRRRYDESEKRRCAEREEAFGELRRVVGKYGGEVSGDEGQVLGVSTYLMSDLERLARERQQDIADWGRFQEALAGCSVEEWRLAAEGARADAEKAQLKADGLKAGLGDEPMWLEEIEVERGRLEELVGRRRGYDESEERRCAEREEAFGELRRVVGKYGGDIFGDEGQVFRVATELLGRHEKAEQEREGAIADWGRFQEALAGCSVEEWRLAAEGARADAEKAQLKADGLKAGLGDEPLRFDRLHIQRPKTEQRLQIAQKEASRTAGQLEQIEADSVDVATAEAGLYEARTELGRVQRLQKTLKTTQEHLQAAAERAHRHLAPKLKVLMSQWIPVITQGRYVEALVDPETLKVNLRTADGTMREAGLVSHGTSEQVYLVLRMILAQVLTGERERCPVLLDDPTVHADDDRKKEVLEYLLQASKTHQVILFTQDRLVVQWARGFPACEKIKRIELPAPVGV